MARVAKREIDEYLNGVGEPARSTLQVLRERIVEVVPDVEQGISYGVPAFRLHGKTIAGFAAFKSHLSYLPHSGRVLARLQADTVGYTQTKSSLHFAFDQPLPDGLVRSLLEVRMAEAFTPARDLELPGG